MLKKLLTLIGVSISALLGSTLDLDTSSSDDPPYAGILGKSLTFGGAHSNINYAAIHDNGLPDRLFMNPDDSINVTAFFAPPPDTEDPGLGGPIVYRWYYWCAEGKEYLSNPIEDYVPGIPGWSPTQGPPWPTLAVTAELAIPEHCREKNLWPGNNMGNFNIEYRGHSGVEYATPGPYISRLDRTDPNYELDPNGDAVLYSIVSEEEVEVIQETGNWLDSASNTMHYFFTACEPAREFRDFLLSVGGSVGGVATATAPVQALGEEAVIAAIEDTAGRDVAIGINRASRGIKSAPALIKIFGDDPGSSMCDV